MASAFFEWHQRVCLLGYQSGRQWESVTSNKDKTNCGRTTSLGFRDPAASIAEEMTAEEITLFQSSWVRGGCLTRSLLPLVRDETWPRVRNDRLDETKKKYHPPTTLQPYLHSCSKRNQRRQPLRICSITLVCDTSLLLLDAFLIYISWEVKEDCWCKDSSRT